MIMKWWNEVKIPGHNSLYWPSDIKMDNIGVHPKIMPMVRNVSKTPIIK